jgi:RNA polymerase sigma-70 factor (ECF subfamily)
MEEQLRQLYRSIRKLHKIERAIIFLYLEKKTYRQIGEIVGLTEKNISVRLVRIKDKLREMMKTTISDE